MCNMMSSTSLRWEIISVLSRELTTAIDSAMILWTAFRNVPRLRSPTASSSLNGPKGGGNWSRKVSQRNLKLLSSSSQDFLSSYFKFSELLLEKANRDVNHANKVVYSVDLSGFIYTCAFVWPGPQYGSVERAWLAMMTEADKVSELHQEVKNGLMNEDIEKVKNWQKDSYHRQMIGGFKETKEAEEGFKKAQKPWAKKLKEVQIKDFNDVNSVNIP